MLLAGTLKTRELGMNYSKVVYQKPYFDFAQYGFLVVTMSVAFVQIQGVL